MALKTKAESCVNIVIKTSAVCAMISLGDINSSRTRKAYLPIMAGGSGVKIATEEYIQCMSFDEAKAIMLSDPIAKEGYDQFNENRNEKLKERFNNGEINILKYNRLKKKITQKQLAKEIGTSQPNIASLERLKSLKNIQYGKLKNILNVLDMTLEEFENG